MREKYERIASGRLGISLEAYRAKKMPLPEKKYLKRNVVKNTSIESRAEKNLASLKVVGNIDCGDVELKEYNKAELELIFEEEYKNYSRGELEREAKSLLDRLMNERLIAERRELERMIRKAEEDGDEKLENELLQQMNNLLRKK